MLGIVVEVNPPQSGVWRSIPPRVECGDDSSEARVVGGPLGAAASAAQCINPAPISQWPEVAVLRRRQRAKAAPAMEFPDAVSQALAEATAFGQVKALPLFKVDKRTAQKGSSHSAARERLHLWCESAEGLEWRRLKAELVAEAGAGAM